MNLKAKEDLGLNPSQPKRLETVPCPSTSVMRQTIIRIQRIKSRLKLCITTTMDEFHDEMQVFSPSTRLLNSIYLKNIQKFLEICHEAAKMNFNEAYYHRITKILRLWLKFKLCCYIEDADKFYKIVMEFIQRNLSGSIQKTVIDVLLVIPKMFESATRFHSKTRSINACKVIFKRYLGQWQGKSQELDDEDFLKHMLCYRAWRNIETDNKRKIEINFLFVGNVRPRSTLTANPKLAPMLPFYYPSEPGAYVTLIERNYCTKRLHQQLDAPFMEELLQDFISPVCCINIVSDDDDVDIAVPDSIEMCDSSADSSSSCKTVNYCRRSLIQVRKCYMSNGSANEIPVKRHHITNTCVLQTGTCLMRYVCQNDEPPPSPETPSPVVPEALPPITLTRRKYIRKPKKLKDIDISETAKRWVRGASLRSVSNVKKNAYSEYVLDF